MRLDRMGGEECCHCLWSPVALHVPLGIVMDKTGTRVLPNLGSGEHK